MGKGETRDSPIVRGWQEFGRYWSYRLNGLWLNECALWKARLRFLQARWSWSVSLDKVLTVNSSRNCKPSNAKKRGGGRENSRRLRMGPIAWVVGVLHRRGSAARSPDSHHPIAKPGSRAGSILWASYSRGARWTSHVYWAPSPFRFRPASLVAAGWNRERIKSWRINS